MVVGQLYFAGAAVAPVLLGVRVGSGPIRESTTRPLLSPSLVLAAARWPPRFYCSPPLSPLPRVHILLGNTQEIPIATTSVVHIFC